MSSIPVKIMWPKAQTNQLIMKIMEGKNKITKNNIAIMC
jgi:hypothetical protein